MKQFRSTAFLIAALIGTSIAASGCGSSGTTATTGTVVGSAGYAYGTTTTITSSGGTVAFGDQNAQNSGGSIIDYTSGFEASGFVPISGYAGALALNTIGLSSGQSGTLNGITTGGSTISVAYGPGNSSCPWGIDLCSGITGTITVSPTDAAVLGTTGLGQIQGLALSLTVSGGVISFGEAMICTARDQYGMCHGIELNFVPH